MSSEFAIATSPLESERLEALRGLMVLDSAAEPLFDSLVRMASEVCGVPISLISLIDAERQWFKANQGLAGVQETPRDMAFCAHAIEGDALFEVKDAWADPRFADNPLVTGEPDIRFYAGVPLVLPGGQRVGTLCVIDRQPRQLSTQQAQQLRQLAELATQALLMRRDLLVRALNVRSRFEAALAESETRYRGIVEHQDELVSQSRPDGTLVFVNSAYATHFGFEPAQMLGRNLYDYVDAADREVVRARMHTVLTTGEGVRSENRMNTADRRELWVAWSNRLQTSPEGEPMLHSVGRDVSARRRAESELRSTQSFLARIGRVAGVGGWELDLESQALRWTEETLRLHEVPADYVPTVAKAIDFYAPEARPLVATAVQNSIDGGEGWDLQLRFITAKGNIRWVRAVGELLVEPGQPRRLVGSFQDITERRALQQRLAENERFVRMVTDSLPVRMSYTDAQRRFRFINAAHARRFGQPPAQILGRTRAEITAGAPSEALEVHIAGALAGQAQHFEFDDVVEGQPCRIDVQFVPDLDEQGQVRGFFATGMDVTERVATQQALQRQTALLQAVTDALPAMVGVAGADGRIRFVNRAFQQWSRLPREALIGQTLTQLLGPRAKAQLMPWIDRALAGETVSVETADAGLRGDQASSRHLAVSFIPLYREGGAVDGVLSVSQDITQQKQEAVRLLELTQRDPLTGLLNRRGASDQFERLMAASDRDSLVLLAVDLDHFKPVNDEHGHAVGDLVLQTFAQRLQRLVRPSDVVARLGGDEFVVLLAGVREPAHAMAVADKIIAAAAEPVQAEALLLQVGASVGVALGAKPGLTAPAAWADLLERADERLYAAKAAGRGRHLASS